MKIKFVYKGGSGSGHYGHVGRPGKQGGSLADAESSIYERDKRDFQSADPKKQAAAGWKKSGSSQVMEKGRVRVTVTPQKDGSREFVAISYQDTQNEDRVVWDSEEFDTMEDAMNKAAGRMDEMEAKFNAPKKRSRRSGPRGAGIDYSVMD